MTVDQPLVKQVGLQKSCTFIFRVFIKFIKIIVTGITTDDQQVGESKQLFNCAHLRGTGMKNFQMTN